MQRLKSLGILGGTFDPIHYGHIVAAECARDACHLDRVLFVPAARPPHKDLNEVLDSQHRFEMVKMAVQDNPDFAASALELKREGLSYTVETIASYQQEFPGAKIFFIIGVDALLLINTWKDVERLATLCNFIVVTRPGYHLRHEEEPFREIPAAIWEKILLVPIPGLYISSSDIRQRVAKGQTIKYLLPPAIEEYILKNDLYTEEEAAND
ncbi:MAG: nicotinic acid mononucleotide adenylyltransferase [Firmicutes bacterium HGW-Firmicutes-15]|nr:MAG: nicotinic acid mononucleotide adenylyltransferase [Firmicutes bacterium HGW-Firmicutes-15]